VRKVKARRRFPILLVVTVLAAGLGSANAWASTASASSSGGSAGLGSPAPVDGLVRAAQAAAGPEGTLDLVVSLDGVASPAMERQLARLGTWSRTFRHVAVAAVRLRTAELETLRRVPGVRGVYLNRRLRFEADESHRLLNTDRVERGLGVTGKGVTIAVLDSGVDFTHPDLAPALRANVKLAGFDEATPITPVPGSPNSDTTSGHGTHVAGDAAGRGTMSGGRFRGIAPGAGLVGVGTGEAIWVFNVVEGFDWILGHKDQYGIRIVTNSWGTDFSPFDPANPVQVATKAATDAGLVVLFAMGNDGDEMTMNPYAAAPWVIPVAAGSQVGRVTDFSSAGIEADVLGRRFAGSDVRGDPRRPLHLGLYHPAITAPGEDIVSTRARNTVRPALAASTDVSSLTADELPWYTTMSGTSMATPEAAGLCALVLEVNPALTPAEVRSILTVTARPIANLPFDKQGYGYADASAAVDLARSLVGRSAGDTAAALEALQTRRDRAVLDAVDHPARTLAFQDSVPAGAGGVSHAIDVPRGSRRLKVVLTAAADAPCEIVVTDAAGRKVAVSSDMRGRSEASRVLDIDVRPPAGAASWAWGLWHISIVQTTPVHEPQPVDFSGMFVNALPGGAATIVAALFASHE